MKKLSLNAILNILARACLLLNVICWHIYTDNELPRPSVSSDLPCQMDRISKNASNRLGAYGTFTAAYPSGTTFTLFYTNQNDSFWKV